MLTSWLQRFLLQSTWWPNLEGSPVWSAGCSVLCVHSFFRFAWQQPSRHLFCALRKPNDSVFFAFGPSFLPFLNCFPALLSLCTQIVCIPQAHPKSLPLISLIHCNMYFLGNLHTACLQISSRWFLYIPVVHFSVPFAHSVTLPLLRAWHVIGLKEIPNAWLNQVINFVTWVKSTLLNRIP